MMTLNQLVEQYKPKKSPTLQSIILQIKKREELLLSLIAMGASISGVITEHGIDYDLITPQMEEAFSLAFPNLELSHLDNLDPDQFSGFIANWKGKYFEVLVRDELNAGQTIGDITLSNGQYAELAESATQPGWDLQIFDANGIPLEQLQLKTTSSINYIKDTLERYPDFEIIGNSEIASQAEILNSYISNDEITTQLTEVFEHADAVIPEVVYDVLPFSGLIIITTLEGKNYLSGKATLSEFAKNTLTKGTENALYTLGGSALFSMFDSGIISIGVPMATKVFLNWKKNSNALTDDLRIYTTNILQYKLDYN